jgi:hypothetical protein
MEKSLRVLEKIWRRFGDLKRLSEIFLENKELKDERGFVLEISEFELMLIKLFNQQFTKC